MEDQFDNNDKDEEYSDLTWQETVDLLDDILLQFDNEQPRMETPSVLFKKFIGHLSQESEHDPIMFDPIQDQIQKKGEKGLARILVLKPQSRL